MSMSKEEAQEKAEKIVYIAMCRGDIEDECRKRKIRITKERSKMEQKLINAYVIEWTK